MVKSSEHGSSNPLNHVFTDSNGEFKIFPIGDARCNNRSSQDGAIFDTGYGTCIAQDGNGAIRYNFWGDTDVRSELQRMNAYCLSTMTWVMGLKHLQNLAFTLQRVIGLPILHMHFLFLSTEWVQIIFT
ncbi:MAG: hypothetical protein Ct9H300mP3_11340 [Gammaproteobacteria bacterium]|nr:MAG: hypothetical protein Ct9H300mP3_11340 [Gammaproteobacteria bacterium]